MTNCTVKTEEVDIDLLLKKNDLAAAKVSRSLFGTCDCWLFFLTRLYCVPCVFFFLRERNFVLMMLVAQFVHGLYSFWGGFILQDFSWLIVKPVSVFFRTEEGSCLPLMTGLLSLKTC